MQQARQPPPNALAARSWRAVTSTRQSPEERSEDGGGEGVIGKWDGEEREFRRQNIETRGLFSSLEISWSWLARVWTCLGLITPSFLFLPCGMGKSILCRFGFIGS